MGLFFSCCTTDDENYDYKSLKNIYLYKVVLEDEYLRNLTNDCKKLDVSSNLSIEVMHIRSFLIENNISLEIMEEPSVYFNSKADINFLNFIKENTFNINDIIWKKNHIVLPVQNHEIRIATIKKFNQNSKNYIMEMLLG